MAAEQGVMQRDTARCERLYDRQSMYLVVARLAVLSWGASLCGRLALRCHSVRQSACEPCRSFFRSIERGHRRPHSKTKSACCRRSTRTCWPVEHAPLTRKCYRGSKQRTACTVGACPVAIQQRDGFARRHAQDAGPFRDNLQADVHAISRVSGGCP